MSSHATGGIPEARPLSQVCLFAGLTVIAGTYDGYGRIEHDTGIHEIDLTGTEPCLVHTGCLMLPRARHREWDPGQGFFYSDAQIREFVSKLRQKQSEDVSKSATSDA